MSAGTVLLSESLVSYVSPVSSPMYVHWNGGVIRSTCHHFSQSPRLHVHSECPLMQRCHQRSSVSHCQVSVSCIQQCPLNGAARLDHQSTATSHLQCFTHTHTHTPSVQWEMVLPSKFTNHSIVLSTVHLCTQWKVILHIAGHYDLTPTVHPDDSLMHAVNP